LLWTDGRYYLQASQELTPAWTLMKAGMPNVPDTLEWIKNNLVRGQRVGVDPWLATAASSIAMRKALEVNRMEVVDITSNPVDAIWSKYNRSAYPSQPIVVLPLNRTGLSHQDKIELVVAELKKQNAVAIIVSMLDEIAW
jgi:Xaa-Pro aminopeptidase